MSSPTDKSKTPKPRTRQSYAAPSIPPPLSRFLPCPSFTSPTFSSNRPQERAPFTCSLNPFQPLSPSPTPTSKQSYALPSTSSTPPLKKPFNVVASSFPPLASSSNQSIDSLPLRKPKSQKKITALNSQKIPGILFYGLNQNTNT